MVNWEISVGNLIEITVIAIGGIWTLFTLRGKVDTVGADVKRLGKRADLIETSVDEVRKAIVQVAVQTERLNNQDARMNRLAQEIRDMKRGDGFVLPLPELK